MGAGHSHIDDALSDSAAGIRAVKISLAVLGLTATIQLVIAAISGSVALLADTVHNFSDALTAVPLWIAFAVSRRAMLTTPCSTRANRRSCVAAASSSKVRGAQ